MNSVSPSATILMAEDDPDDRLLVEEAWLENRLANVLHFVEDGEQLMDRLYQRGNYTDVTLWPRPDLILLDLNMPKKDGREALAEIKSNPELRQIPVVVMTTSKAEEDILRTYNLGANSFVLKPVTFDRLVQVLKTLQHYWFQIVLLPAETASHDE